MSKSIPTAPATQLSLYAMQQQAAAAAAWQAFLRSVAEHNAALADRSA